jgi:hypothetical protein
MADSLRIMEWNANGVFWHHNKLQVILSTENKHIFISETHFTKEPFIRFRNYITYRTIHPSSTARGGSILIIRNNIKHFEEDIQTTIVKLETSKQRLTVRAIYCPPKYNISANECTALFVKMSTPFIIRGGFRAKHPHWGSRHITSSSSIPTSFNCNKVLICPEILRERKRPSNEFSRVNKFERT